MAKEKKPWITLNVGGQYFTTSRSTLTRSTPPFSALHRISTNSTNVHFDRDERGAYLIDRDPAYFQVVLNYLRHGHVLLTRDVTEEGVLLEADYFNLPELARTIRQRLSLRSLGFLATYQQQQQQQQQHQAQTHQQQHNSHDPFQSSWAAGMGLSLGSLGSLSSTPSTAVLGSGLSSALEV